MWPCPASSSACNAEAKEATRKGQDSRGGAPAGPTARAPGSNPQREGIDQARAGEPAYQAAYRACMRKAGF